MNPGQAVHRELCTACPGINRSVFFLHLGTLERCECRPLNLCIERYIFLLEFLKILGRYPEEFLSSPSIKFLKQLNISDCIMQVRLLRK